MNFPMSYDELREYSLRNHLVLFEAMLQRHQLWKENAKDERTKSFHEPMAGLLRNILREYREFYNPTEWH